MKVIDLHCDALDHVTPSGEWKGTVTVPALRKGNALAQCFAIFTDPKKIPRERGGSYRFYRQKLRAWHAMLEREKQNLAPACSPQELRRNLREGKISAILTVEGGDFLEGKPERVVEAFSQGVRMITLTWNHPNCLGFPNHADSVLHGLPLTEFGREAVERMQSLGILVDASHLSEGGFWELTRICKAPFLASHSCCRELCDHPRNLSDSQLRALGERGGVVGLNFYSRFLREGCKLSCLEDLVAHARHIAKVAGVESLCLGSDFDGIDTPTEFGGWEGMDRVLEALSSFFTPCQLDGICRNNFLRFWQEASGKEKNGFRRAGIDKA